MTDFDLHLEAMEAPEYAIHHNRMFHGAGHININAMQMCENDKIDDKPFSPTQLYDVYYKNELFGTPLYTMLTSHEICDKLGFSRGVWLNITQADFDLQTGCGSEYLYIKSGVTSVEWNINGKLFYDNASASKHLDVTPASLYNFVKSGRISRQFVILDNSGDVVSEVV